ncbi:hypothetical protein B9Z19DRAFT_975098 [Tuber borchii]|uniref:Uncharacterized protein n=1 Tax=Tuber borchii TaxID=42251 RepID=A0A2T6ZY05_TUBBO|nr:hypothetical protein B9Z19DRAFT_975098 [Tuber borchii]
MQDFYRDMGGKPASLKITEFEVEIPQPEFYIDPEYRVRVGSVNASFQLTGISPKTISKRFTKVEAGNFCAPINSSFILRKEYIRMEKLLQEKESAKWIDKKEGKRRSGGVALDYKVSGQPGSGKTTFLLYILARRVAARLPTVYRVSDDTCYYFDTVHKGRCITAQQLFKMKEPKQRDLWILTDWALVDPLWNKYWHSWFVVLGTSENKVKCSQYWANGRNARETYINNWEWEEIYTAYTLDCTEAEPPTPIETQDLYTTFICLGPVARTCLVRLSPKLGIEEYDMELKARLTKIDRYIQKVLAKFQLGYLENAVGCFETHKIIRMEPCDKSTSYIPELMTRWIACRIHHYAELGAKMRGYNMFLALCDQPKTRTSAGWIFERYAHSWLRAGGRFRVDRVSLDNSGGVLAFDINFANPEESPYYKTLNDLGDELKSADGRGIESTLIGTYFQPKCVTQESFDSLVLISNNILVLFQITMAKSHEIKVNGVCDILNALPKSIDTVFIIFVIPEDRVNNYRVPQKAPTSDHFRIGRKRYTIEQFRLVFSNKEIMKIALPKPRVS